MISHSNRTTETFRNCLKLKTNNSTRWTEKDLFFLHALLTFALKTVPSHIFCKLTKYHQMQNFAEHLSTYFEFAKNCY